VIWSHQIVLIWWLLPNHHDIGAAFSVAFWVGGYWPRVEGWAFSCLLQMTFKELHIPDAPHSNNISQLVTELSKVLWVAGHRLWSRRLLMWCVHDGIAVSGSTRGGFPPFYEFLKKIWICIWSDSRYIPVSNLLTYLKISWDFEGTANFVLFYLNEGQNLLTRN
jgi:hypothetical protein